MLRMPLVTRTRIVLLATPLLGVALAIALFSTGQADRSGERCAGDPRLADLANGEGTVAILNRDVVVIGEDGSGERPKCVHQRSASSSGLLRHVAAEPGFGTAFVKDLAGDDLLVVMTPDGTTEIDGDGEITQPAWSPEGDLVWSLDMTEMSLLPAGSDQVRTIPAPRAAIGIFSPRFTGTESLTAVAQEAVDGAPAEDDALNNLFEYDMSDGSWTRLTSFTATAEDWNAIRTPLTMPDGSTLFVRIQGNVHDTHLPDFELWRESEGTVHKLRTLPREMFLAGLRGESLLWNISTPDCGDWELFVEEPSGLRSLGCGAVTVDPVNLADPDLIAPADTSIEETDAAVAVVVGDFATRAAAKNFARSVEGRVEVVGHLDAPMVVKPGAFAVAQRVPTRGDPEAALSAMKRSLDSAKEVFIAPFPETP